MLWKRAQQFRQAVPAVFSKGLGLGALGEPSGEVAGVCCAGRVSWGWMYCAFMQLQNHGT
jgi:hypothetical protein